MHYIVLVRSAASKHNYIISICKSFLNCTSTRTMSEKKTEATAAPPCEVESVKSPSAPNMYQPQPPLICCRTGRKIRRNPGVLVRWMYLHERNYYPTKSEKEELCHDAGMTIRQLNDWFANARRNIKKKGMEYWKKKHSPYSAHLTQRDGSGLLLPHHNIHADLGYQRRPATPTGSSPLPPPTAMSYFATSSHLANISSASSSVGVGGGSTQVLGLSPVTSAIESQSPVQALQTPPSAPAYYPSYLNKTLSYHPGSGTDQNGLAMPNGQPMIMDGFFHQFSQSPRAFKVYTPGMMMSQHFAPHHCSYKLPPSSPAQLSQLSTGSSPYSENMSPILCKSEPDSPSSCAVNASAASGPLQLQLSCMKDEAPQPWNGPEQQEVPRLVYAYQPHMPALNWGTAAADVRSYWGSGNSAGGGYGPAGEPGVNGDWNPEVPPPDHHDHDSVSATGGDEVEGHDGKEGLVYVKEEGIAEEACYETQADSETHAVDSCD